MMNGAAGLGALPRCVTSSAAPVSNLQMADSIHLTSNTSGVWARRAERVVGRKDVAGVDAGNYLRGSAEVSGRAFCGPAAGHGAAARRLAPEKGPRSGTVFGFRPAGEEIGRHHGLRIVPQRTGLAARQAWPIATVMRHADTERPFTEHYCMRSAGACSSARAADLACSFVRPMSIPAPAGPVSGSPLAQENVVEARTGRMLMEVRTAVFRTPCDGHRATVFRRSCAHGGLRY